MQKMKFGLQHQPQRGQAGKHSEPSIPRTQLRGIRSHDYAGTIILRGTLLSTQAGFVLCGLAQASGNQVMVNHPARNPNEEAGYVEILSSGSNYVARVYPMRAAISCDRANGQLESIMHTDGATLLHVSNKGKTHCVRLPQAMVLAVSIGDRLTPETVIGFHETKSKDDDSPSFVCTNQMHMAIKSAKPEHLRMLSDLTGQHWGIRASITDREWREARPGVWYNEPFNQGMSRLHLWKEFMRVHRLSYKNDVLVREQPARPQAPKPAPQVPTSYMTSEPTKVYRPQGSMLVDASRVHIPDSALVSA